MEGLQGIPLEPTIDVQREQEKLEERNRLQLQIAEELGFLEAGKEDGEIFYTFIDRYGPALGDMFKDHPEIVDEYEAYRKISHEVPFDTTHIKEMLPRYLEKTH